MRVPRAREKLLPRLLCVFALTLSRGQGSVEERDQLTQAEMAKKGIAPAKAWTQADLSKLARGDLVLRMPLQLPSSCGSHWGR